MSPERIRLLRRLVPALLLVGTVLLVGFEATVTLFVGVVLLLAAVACGVAMIAEPGFLAADADAEAGAEPSGHVGSAPAPASGDDG